MRPLILATGLLASPALCLAQTPAQPPAAQPASDAKSSLDNREGMLIVCSENERVFEMGVEVFGMVTGNFISEPADDPKIISAPNGQPVDVPYPGFGGVGGGGGIAVTGMYRGIVGFDMQLSYSNDTGTGEVNGQNFSFSQTALHLPLHLRVAVPGETVRPFLFGGVEFVFPGDTTVDESPTLGFGNSIIDIGMSADTYYVWSFGLGFDFILPIEGHDIRIPFKLKGSVNPNVGPNPSDRMDLSGPANDPSQWKLNVDSQLEWQAAVQLGIAYYFM